MNVEQDTELHDDAGVEANARVTGSMGAVLLVLLAAEGATLLLKVDRTISAHLFIGMMLVPPVLVKTGTTVYRFARYYASDPRFVRKGPPPILLRLAGPVVVLTTVAVIASGIALTLAGPSAHLLGLAHRASFVLWFVVMTVHVLGHLRELPTLAFADWRRRAGSFVPGRGTRLAVLASTIVLGILAGTWALGWAGPWQHLKPA